METAVKSDVIRVVIVEDFKLTRVGLRCALNENNDIQVVAEFENAIDGIKYVEHYKPDVVLMDLGLPVMNGIEATMKIKEISPETKVIALTSHNRGEEVVATLSSGASGYCLKDIDPQKLAGVIRDVAMGVCWIDSEVAPQALSSLVLGLLLLNLLMIPGRISSSCTERRLRLYLVTKQLLRFHQIK